jgi:hypothetical protein
MRDDPSCVMGHASCAKGIVPDEAREEGVTTDGRTSVIGDASPKGATSYGALALGASASRYAT